MVLKVQDGKKSRVAKKMAMAEDRLIGRRHILSRLRENMIMKLLKAHD